MSTPRRNESGTGAIPSFADRPSAVPPVSEVALEELHRVAQRAPTFVAMAFAPGGTFVE